MAEVPLFLLLFSFLLPHLSSVAAVPSNIWVEPESVDRAPQRQVGAEATEPDQKLSFILPTRARGGLLNLQLERTPSYKCSGVKPQGTGS